MAEGKSDATPLNSLNPNKGQLDPENEVHYVSELPLVPKWQAVKLERSKKTSILVLRRMVFFVLPTLTAGHLGTSGSSET